jgi:hypothetical protein
LIEDPAPVRLSEYRERIHDHPVNIHPRADGRQGRRL